MLRNYYRLNFFLEYCSPKTWVSNISVRWCNQDGTPKTYSSGWVAGPTLVEDENGTKFKFSPLFYITKFPAGYHLNIHNRREGRCFMPCRYYPSFEEACFAAREAWIKMESDLTDDDLKIIDHTHMMEWRADSTAERMKKKNLPNFKVTSHYQKKSLVEWDNYEPDF